MIIIDENVDKVIIDRLDKEFYEIISIKEHYRGISDRKVIELEKYRKENNHT